MKRLVLTAGLLAAGLALLGTGLRFPRGAEPYAMPALPSPTPSNLAGQLGEGEGLFRLYCVTCHGDRLRGLTPEWLAQWPTEDQNCWRSKCHSLNNPPDGFILPHDIPALAGAGALAEFRTAADLHAFIQVRMPFQEPGRLTDDQYWAIAAYVLSWNDAALPETLGADNAADTVIHPQAVGTPAAAQSPTATAGSAAEPPASGIDPGVATIAVVLGAAVGVGLFLRRRRTFRS